jgi:predicted nucleic acid-binding protein
LSLVIDASVTLAWVLADETTPAALALRARVIKEGALAPQHWRLEVCNGLLMAGRRKRYDLSAIEHDLRALRLLPVLIDSATEVAAWKETTALALAHKLSLYDAAYLELAQRAGLALATFDAELSKAAKVEGIKLA